MSVVRLYDDTSRIFATLRSNEEGKLIPQVCGSLKEALEELDKGRAFLTKGGVFSDEFIDAYIELKSEEEIKVRTFVHPLEYDLYYSV